MKKDEGFSFIEVIVSLAIILVLSAAVGFSAVRYIDRARTTACITQIDSLRMALQAYFIDCGRFPTKEQGLAALWEKPHISPVPDLWNGPYTDSEIPDDPWGNPFVYEVPGKNGLPYSIISYGADGEEGGEGSDADIVSWKKQYKPE